ncbi:TOPRIM nucleotidyl transferase/hydrolase domain-containing protein [Streptomyces sp. NPDC048254]|uniref:TOPRIM nucleotidyl transferase/hydrolase domain-containing protein n=1 Tax=Streptomyces sp. NPDC048254 TaxID=3365525 RepID=UPI00371CD87E
MAEMRAFRDAVTSWAAGGPDGPARDLAESLGVRTAVLLEGLSDLAAVEALAARRGRDLAAEGVCVVPMGGAMSVGRYAGLLGPPGLGLHLTGLCVEGEKGFYERGLTRARAPLQDIHVCTADLEDELIRALGVAGVEEILRAEGEMGDAPEPSAGPGTRGPSAQPWAGARTALCTRYGASPDPAARSDSGTAGVSVAGAAKPAPVSSAV